MLLSQRIPVEVVHQFIEAASRRAEVIAVKESAIVFDVDVKGKNLKAPTSRGMGE
jgi:hypothetical protein